MTSYLYGKINNKFYLIVDYEPPYVVENKDKSYTLKTYENIELIDI